MRTSTTPWNPLVDELSNSPDDDLMAWKWLDRWFAKDSGPERGTNVNLPEIHWIDPSNNPWGVPVLDVRPVTLGMLSSTKDQQIAVNAMSFTRDDGTGFIGVEPAGTQRIPVGLSFPIDRTLADGASLFPRRWSTSGLSTSTKGRFSASEVGSARSERLSTFR